MNIQDLVSQYTEGLIGELELVSLMQVSPRLLARIQKALSLPYKAACKIKIADLISDDPRDAPMSTRDSARAARSSREDEFDL